jgi:hypothetical protein
LSRVGRHDQLIWLFATHIAIRHYTHESRNRTMTQQPYYPPQPQQGYPPQPPPQQYQPQFPQAPQQPAPGYPPQQYAPPGYAPQGYPPQQPQQPLAQGGLDEFYSQPSAGAGPGISWSDAQKMPRPIGTTFVGVVVRDVSNADVQQQTSPQGAPAFFRDGRPKFQMKVPLKQVAMFADPNLTQQLPTPEFPEGEATWYVRGQARDELTRAMAEAGSSGAPRGGAVVMITLVNRRPNGGGMQPSNIVQVRYLPAESGQGAEPQGQPAQQPPAQVAPPAPVEQAPQQQQLPPQWAQPQPQQQVPAAQQAPAPQQPQGQAVQQGQPQPQWDPGQQALFAKITGQQPPQQGQPAA